MSAPFGSVIHKTRELPAFFPGGYSRADAWTPRRARSARDSTRGLRKPCPLALLREANGALPAKARLRRLDERREARAGRGLRDGRRARGEGEGERAQDHVLRQL